MAVSQQLDYIWLRTSNMTTFGYMWQCASNMAIGQQYDYIWLRASNMTGNYDGDGATTLSSILNFGYSWQEASAAVILYSLLLISTVIVR